jgi:effector-binding domain-containing protein
MMLSYDEEYKEKDADIEMAFPITGEISTNEPSIIVKTLPKCRVISGIHKGSYHNIDKIYAQIFEYLERQNLTLVTPIRELYLRSLDEVQESELLTEIQCPFKQ